MTTLAAPPDSRNKARRLLASIGVTFDERQSHECIRHPYEGWEGQWEIMTAPYQEIMVAGGEQRGKSHMAAGKMEIEYFSPMPEFDDPYFVIHGKPRPRLYWLVGAAYSETEREYSYLVDWNNGLGLLKTATKNVDPGEIELKDGTRIQTKSATDITKLSKESPDGIVICEASQVDKTTYDRCRGRITARKGFLFMAGTFETSNGWFPQLFNAWQFGYGGKRSYSQPSYLNRTLYKEGRDDPKLLALQRDSSDDFFTERIEGKPVPPKGLVHSEVRKEIHVGRHPHIPGVPVFLGIDPGIAGAYAVLAKQHQGEQEVLIGEVYERNLFTKEVIDKCKKQRWWRDVTGGAIDYAAFQRPTGQPGTVHDIWLSETGINLQANRVPILDGIERVKSFFRPDPITRKPKLVIDEGCVGLLSELGILPNPFDGETAPYLWKLDREGHVTGDVPVDKNNHSIKALAYMVIAEFGYTMAQRRTKMRVVRH